MKHELFALFRTLIFFIVAVLLVSIITRIFAEVSDFSEAQDFGMNLGMMLSQIFITNIWLFSIIFLAYAAMILSVVIFFKSLFTGQGYLTFSLPVTPTQLLVSKLLSALIASLACALTVVLSLVIALPSAALIEFVDTVLQILSDLMEVFASAPLLGIESVLLALVLLPTGLLYLFLIACIGQLFSKRRVLITIALYYGVSFLLSFLFILFFFPLVINLSVYVSIHLFMWLAILIVVAFDVGSFFLMRYILTRKVNLVVS